MSPKFIFHLFSLPISLQNKERGRREEEEIFKVRKAQEENLNSLETLDAKKKKNIKLITVRKISPLENSNSRV